MLRSSWAWRNATGLPAESAALGIGDRRSNLYRRVLMLINSRQPLERRCPGLWSLAVTIVAVGLLAGIAAVRLDAGDTKTEKETPKKEIKGKPRRKSDKLDYTGRVTDKDTGKPIAERRRHGAPFALRRPRGEAGKLDHCRRRSTRTDKDGKYSFTIPAEQASMRYLYIELDVEGPGHAPQKGFRLLPDHDPQE